MTTEPDRRQHGAGADRRKGSGDGSFASLFGKLAVSSSLLLMMRGVNAIFLFLISIMLGRTLGPEQYGIFAFGAALLAVLIVPAKFGFDNLLTAEVPTMITHGRFEEVRGLVRRAIRLAIFAGTGILVVWGLLALWQPSALSASLWVGGAIALTALPLLAVLHVRLGALRAQHRVVQGQLPIFLIQPGLLLAAVTVWAVLAPEMLDGYLALVLLAATMGVVCMLSFSILPPAFRSGTPSDAGPRRSAGLMARALPYLIIGTMSVLMTHTGVLMLGILLGEREAGLFQPAAQLAAVIVLGLQMVNQPLGPMISQLQAEGRRGRLQHLIDRAFWASLALGLPVALALILGGRYALRLYGPEFEIAAPTLAILAAGQVVNLLFGPCALILMMTGTQKLLAILLSVAALLNFSLAVWLIPRFGIEGAACATLVTITSWNATVSYVTGRWYGIRSSFLMGWCVREWDCEEAKS